MTLQRRLPLLAAILAIAATPARTQPSQSGTIGSGWFVQAGAGIGAHDNGPFSRRLQSYTPLQRTGESFLYETESFSQVGYTIGGAAGYLLDGGVLLGASGEVLMFPTVLAITSPGVDRDEYSLGGWEAGIDIGYALIDADATIVYPFLHAGYAGYALEYTNNQSEPIPFFEGDPVPAGTTATYRSAAPRAAIGVGLNSFVGGGGVGGFMIGARLAYGRMLFHPEWEQAGDVVNNGGHSPCYNALSLSLAIGFGG